MPSIYEQQTRLFDGDGEVVGNVYRLVWSVAGDDSTVWMADRISSTETFHTDTLNEAYEWLATPTPVLITEPEQPEPVATPQPTTPRRRK